MLESVVRQFPNVQDRMATPTMASDPRVHKPRVPKAYTDAQLTFLKSHLTEFERRSHGTIRGDAKKFALERATEFIHRFGLPEEFVRLEDDEGKFREQIYNWFKNTAGRSRRKAEGRTRTKKASGSSTGILQKSQQDLEQPTNLTWNPVCTPPIEDPYSSHSQAQAQGESTHATNLDISVAPPQVTQQAQVQPQPRPQIVPHVNVQYAPSLQQPTTSHGSQISQGSLTPQPQVTPTHLGHIKITLRDAFLQGVDASTLASMIHTFVISEHPTSATPLAPVIEALFEAVSSDATSSRNPYAYLRRFLDASAYFTPAIIHAGVSGPLAGPRAIQMQVRRNSMWIPSTRISPPNSGSLSIADEMQRIAHDRQRRKDHIQWANIHAAALELGMLGLGPHTGDMDNNNINNGYAYAMGRALSETMARDAVWEPDEVEWVAGICVLRAVIRTAVRGDRRQRDEYDELLRTYEGRWKEIKDEARQALVTEVLLAAKDDLARLDESC